MKNKLKTKALSFLRKLKIRFSGQESSYNAFYINNNIYTNTLWMLVLFFALGCAFNYINDYTLGIGPAYIRYDADSNMLKIGNSNGVPPKLAREFNAELFKINHDNFTWTAADGLCLLPSSIGDSVSLKQLSIHYDTTVGENIYTKLWTLKREKYYLDSNLLVWNFLNTKYNTSANFYVINMVTPAHIFSNLDHSIEPLLLTTSLQNIDTLIVPFEATWRFTMFLDYEFEFGAINTNCVDSIVIEIWQGRDDIIAHFTRKIAQLADMAGEAGSGSINAVFRSNSADNIRIRAFCSENAVNTFTGKSALRKIAYYKAELELIQ